MPVPQSSKDSPSTSALPMTRREAVKLTASAAVLSWLTPALAAQTAKPKRVIVVGGGIGGLCAGYELMKRGHDVVVLEAAGRAGGHVRSIHDPLPDGLYADLGAEQCTKPGYELWRQYAREFGLELVPYRRRDGESRYIDGKLYTEEMLA